MVVDLTRTRVLSYTNKNHMSTNVN